MEPEGFWCKKQCYVHIYEKLYGYVKGFWLIWKLKSLISVKSKNRADIFSTMYITISNQEKHIFLSFLSLGKLSFNIILLWNFVHVTMCLNFGEKSGWDLLFSVAKPWHDG